MKKKLLALLLCLTMLLVMLPTVAMAEGDNDGEEVTNPTIEIANTIWLNGTRTLPTSANFEFEIVDDEGKSLSDFGITINNPADLKMNHDDFALDTTGTAGNFYCKKTVSFRYDSSREITPGNGWAQNSDVNPTSYIKMFKLKEKNNQDAGWEYAIQDPTEYKLKFEYTINTRELTCTVHGGNEQIISIGFINRYTANNSSIVIIVPETTEAAPNPTTGAAPANLGLGCVVIGLAAMGAVAYARKK